MTSDRTTTTRHVAGPPEVLIGLPPDFRDVPLVVEGPENGVSATEAWYAAADYFLDLLPVNRPPEHRRIALAHLAAYSQVLAAGWVVKAAACLGTSGGELSTAAVLVSWVPSAGPVPAEVAAAGLHRGLEDRSPGRDVYAIDLPVGPAVAVVAERALRGDGLDGPVEVPVRSIEVSIPVDQQPWVLVVALSSPSFGDWTSYEAIMAEICRSIRFSSAED